MNCPYCNSKTVVLDSRTLSDNTIRRRRECSVCKKRFTTHETLEKIDLLVIKKDKTRQPYNREKIKNGIIQSCVKRQISVEQIDKLMLEIENELFSLDKVEVTSDEIGEIVLNKLKNLDQVAYVRFASVYRDFKEVSNFGEEVLNIKNEK